MLGIAGDSPSSDTPLPQLCLPRQCCPVGPVSRVSNARVVLVCTQIAGMRDRLGFWCSDVKSMEMLVEHQAHDILT